MMAISAVLDAAIQNRILDYFCTPVTCLPAWASDGALVRLAIVGASAWLVAQMLGGQPLLMRSDARRAVDQALRHVGVVAEAWLAHSSRRLAARHASWLDACGLAQTAARVRMVNGLA